MLIKFKKIFSAEKCIDSLILNLFGLQALRYLIANILYKIFFINKKKTQFYKLGFDVIENFLSSSDFLKIREEYFKLILDTRYAKEIRQTGDLLESIKITHVNISDEIKNEYPHIYKLVGNLSIRKFFSENECKDNFTLYAYLEQITVINDKNLDINKSYHYDTFHNTFKSWLYIDDVTEKKGPFHFYPKSHKLSLSRFFKEWFFSILYSIKILKFDSFRFGNSQKLKNIIDNKSVKISYPSNSLVMANTHGLHRRGDAKLNSTRNAIHFYTRENPFKLIKKIIS